MRGAVLHGEVERGAVCTGLPSGNDSFDERHRILCDGRAVGRFCKRYFWCREKLVPTTMPTTVPMSAPAIKSENQWMVMDTPTPM